MSDIQDYFVSITGKLGEKANNTSIRIYVNKIKNRITFKIKTAHYLKLLMLEKNEVIWITKNKISKNENCKNVPHLEITEAVFEDCNSVNDYQQDSRDLYTLVSNKLFK